MDPDTLDDDQLDALAAKLAPRLPTGTHGDRVILPRRAFIGGAVGTLGAGALMALGVDEAAAQAAGQQGTASEPNDMYAYDLNVANQMTSSLPMGGNDIEDAGSVSTGGLVTALGELNTKTVSVGTSNTDILTNDTFGASYIAIVGNFDTSAADRWTDVIVAVSGALVDTISSISRADSPTRSYSINDTNVALSLSSGPIDVDIQWWQF